MKLIEFGKRFQSEDSCEQYLTLWQRHEMDKKEITFLT